MTRRTVTNYQFEKSDEHELMARNSNDGMTKSNFLVFRDSVFILDLYACRQYFVVVI